MKDCHKKHKKAQKRRKEHWPSLPFLCFFVPFCGNRLSMPGLFATPRRMKKAHEPKLVGSAIPNPSAAEPVTGHDGRGGRVHAVVSNRLQCLVVRVTRHLSGRGAGRGGLGIARIGAYL